MFSRLLMLKDFLIFYSQAGTVYSQDSPTLYDFCDRVLDSKKNINLTFTKSYREKCLTDHSQIVVNTIGRESIMLPDNQASVKCIVKTASSSILKCELLIRLAHWNNSTTILELGTNLGIMSSALAENGFIVTSIEGNPKLFSYAKSNLNGFVNCQIIESLFSNFLKDCKSKYDLILIDGNHSYESTIEIIDISKNLLNPEGIIIIDDIRWSAGMKKSWQHVQSESDFNLFIDLFFLGIIGHKSHLQSQLNQKLIPYKFKPWPCHLFRT